MQSTWFKMSFCFDNTHFYISSVELHWIVSVHKRLHKCFSSLLHSSVIHCHHCHHFVVCYCLFQSMALYPPDLSIQESKYFNWHWIICSKLALSPLKLEMQQITYDQSVYEGVNGEKWVKCDDCMSPFHLKCCTNESKQTVTKKQFICTFFSCNKN